MGIAETALHTLQQGRCPVEDYTVDFHKWSTDTGWNEAALKCEYGLSLFEALKNKLARVKAPASLDCLIKLAIQLDRCLLCLQPHLLLLLKENQCRLE